MEETRNGNIGGGGGGRRRRGGGQSVKPYSSAAVLSTKGPLHATKGKKQRSSKVWLDVQIVSITIDTSARGSGQSRLVV
jgi:hypothetical protein